MSISNDQPQHTLACAKDGIAPCSDHFGWARAMMDRTFLIKAGQAASEKHQAYMRRRSERQKLFRTSCESGVSREVIAAKMGVSTEHVRDHARSHGYPVPPVSRHHAKLGKRKPKGGCNAR